MNKKKLLVIIVIILLGISFIYFVNNKKTGIQKGDFVKIEYQATFKDGTIFDSNIGGKTLDFTVGKGETIPGIENKIIGMKLNQTKNIKISPKNGYGKDYDPRKIQKINGIIFQNLNIKPEINKFYKLQNLAGIIKEINTNGTNQTIIFDTNPRQTRDILNYKITIKDIIKNPQI